MVCVCVCVCVYQLQKTVFGDVLFPNKIGCTLVQPLRKTAWRFLRKLKTELSYDPAIPVYTIIGRDTCTPTLITALFTITQTWKQPDVHR